jgi:hypothetical protein
VTVKRILILANSKKHQGHCIAGKEVLQGRYDGWVRPVSNRPDSEISENECLIHGLRIHPQPLDVVRIAFEKHHPKGCHTENWLIDTKFSCGPEGKITYQDALLASDKPPILWNVGRSTYHGRNDEISEAEATQLGYSIVLIFVPMVTLVVIDKAYNSPVQKPALQARFDYNGNEYRLWVTDPFMEARFKKEVGHVAKLGECLLTVSLAEARPKTNGIGNYHFKLVAAIIEKP